MDADLCLLGLPPLAAACASAARCGHRRKSARPAGCVDSNRQGPQGTSPSCRSSRPFTVISLHVETIRASLCDNFSQLLRCCLFIAQLCFSPKLQGALQGCDQCLYPESPSCSLCTYQASYLAEAAFTEALLTARKCNGGSVAVLPQARRELLWKQVCEAEQVTIYQS